MIKKTITGLLLLSIACMLNFYNVSAENITKKNVDTYVSQNGSNSDQFIKDNTVDGVIVSSVSNTIVSYDNSNDIEYDPDPYESNDTKDTAYPYSQVNMLTGNAYVDGYRNASLHSVDDVDWYYLYLTAGTICFVDLRNLSPQRDWNIEVRRYNDDGSYRQWAISDENIGEQQGGYEKFFYFTPDITDKYYVLVTGDGVPYNIYYFMYCGPADRTVTKTSEYPIGQMKIYGGIFTSFIEFDGTQPYLYPAHAKIESLALSNDQNGGYCSKIRKKITANSTGVSYTNTAGNTTINGIQGRKISQTWRVQGWCACGGSHSTATWTPKITVKYSYTMGPLPDNSVAQN